MPRCAVALPATLTAWHGGRLSAFALCAAVLPVTLYYYEQQPYPLLCIVSLVRWIAATRARACVGCCAWWWMGGFVGIPWLVVAWWRTGQDMARSCVPSLLPCMPPAFLTNTTTFHPSQFVCLLPLPSSHACLPACYLPPSYHLPSLPTLLHRQ